MILESEVFVTLNANNYNYFLDKGYILPKYMDKKGRSKHYKQGDTLLVKVLDLPRISNVLISSMCIHCTKLRILPFYKESDTCYTCSLTVRHGSAADKSIKFWSRIDKTEYCWNWTGPVSNRGHGCVTIDRIPMTAYRYSWLLHNGPVPDKLYVLHKCDNRLCVKPDHLWLGTQSDNMQDMVSKGRHRYA